ncbi:MAG: hypothetical protein GXY33_20685 [Phycisphaerae bacterium]|nr:hypothetical protein [Phycisphaerae bacterium]
MNVIDYGRSFVHGTSPANRLRLWVESRTRIIDEPNGVQEDFIQCGACKSENTFAERDLFIADNYDFTPVFGAEVGVIFRRRASVSDNYRNITPYDRLWGTPKYRIVEPASVRELTSFDEIRQATHDGLPMVSQTEIHNEQTGLRAIIECPVKTMNIEEQRSIYQVDIGPVAFADLSERSERLAECIHLAFLAFNAPDFTDFVIEAPTTIGTAACTCRVHHYSKIVSLPATNRIYALGG